MQPQPHTATGVDKKENKVVCTQHIFISLEGVLGTLFLGSTRTSVEDAATGVSEDPGRPSGLASTSYAHPNWSSFSVR